MLNMFSDQKSSILTNKESGRARSQAAKRVWGYPQTSSKQAHFVLKSCSNARALGSELCGNYVFFHCTSCSSFLPRRLSRKILTISHFPLLFALLYGRPRPRLGVRDVGTLDKLLLLSNKTEISLVRRERSGVRGRRWVLNSSTS